MAAALIILFHYAVSGNHPYHSDGQHSSAAPAFWQGLDFDNIAHTIAVLGQIIAIDQVNPIWKAAKFLDVLAGLYNKATGTFGLLTLDPAVLALVISVCILILLLLNITNCIIIIGCRRWRGWSSPSSTFFTTPRSRPRSS